MAGGDPPPGPIPRLATALATLLGAGNFEAFHAMGVNALAIEQTLSDTARRELDIALDDAGADQQQIKRAFDRSAVLRQAANVLCDAAGVPAPFVTVAASYLAAAEALLAGGKTFSGRSRVYVGVLERLATEQGLSVFRPDAVAGETAKAGALSIYGPHFLVDLNIAEPGAALPAEDDAKLLVVIGNVEAPLPHLDAPLTQLLRECRLRELRAFLADLALLERSSANGVNAVQQLLIYMHRDLARLQPQLGAGLSLDTSRPRWLPSLPLWVPFREQIPAEIGAGLNQPQRFDVSVALEPAPPARARTFLPAAGDTVTFVDVDTPSAAVSSDLPTAAAEFVLRIEPPVIFDAGMARRLYRFVTGDADSDFFGSPAPADAVTFVAALVGARAGRESRLLLCPDGPVQHHALVTSDKGSLGVLAVSRVPLRSLARIQGVLRILRAQIVFNKLIASCLQPARYLEAPADAPETVSVRVVAKPAQLTLAMSVQVASRASAPIQLALLVKGKNHMPVVDVELRPGASLPAGVVSAVQQLSGVTAELPIVVDYLYRHALALG